MECLVVLLSVSFVVMVNNSVRQCIIVDFGSQFTKLIARRVRQLRLDTVVASCKELRDDHLLNSKSIILSGSPASVDLGAERVRDIVQTAVSNNTPVLAICYAMQAVCSAKGGTVSHCHSREYGSSRISITNHKCIFRDIPSEINVWMSHSDTVTKLPDNFIELAVSENRNCIAARDPKHPVYCTQFHPEVSHTEYGLSMLRNFLFEISGCTEDWHASCALENILNTTRASVGNGRVIAAVSGGVDSTVAASIVHRICSKDLACILVDTGLLRKHEVAKVEKIYQNLGMDLNVVDAKQLFLERLKDVSDPEKKRKIIGKTFIDVFEKEAKKLDGITHLLQGTLYPDVIESLSGGLNSMIKSHHNVGGLPDKMNLLLVEPLRELFKDEVREIGKLIGIPDEFLFKHPFPGPGLSVRIMGSVTEEKLAVLREVDDVFLQCIINEGLYNKIWQAFAVLLDTKTVGVMGDSRSYENVCALRAVVSDDGMTADSYEFEPKFLKHVCKSIVNKVPGVSRVVYDITSKPPGTIEWE